MDYYESSSRGGRSSYRGSSYRGSSSSRGLRGSRGGGYSSRGGGRTSTMSTTPSYNKYESASNKYSSSFDSGKYGSVSSSSYGTHRSDDYYSRRSERSEASSYGSRERGEPRSEITDLASRKRDRSDSYSQGITRRPHEEEYRTSTRYSGGSSSYTYERETRPYEEPRPFKKPRTADYREFKADYKSEHRVKEPIRTRAPRGRPLTRGGFSTRARGSASLRRPRSESFLTRSARGIGRTATTSEILAIRRAKLLQKRMKEENAATEGKDIVKKEDGEAAATDTTEKVAEEEVPLGDLLPVTASGKPFMKLQCPMCSIKCVTFREYHLHLNQPLHVSAMKVKADELKATLAGMRIAQREKQKKIEADDLESLSTETNFCPICKLNYSQEKMVHETSDMHREMKEFLLPICKVCRLKFQSTLVYQTHLCSVTHLKNKFRLEEQAKRESGSGLLDRFMVLDSVGSGDEADEKDEDKAKEDSAAKEADNLQLGLEYIHEVKAMYCEVCRLYLPRSRDYAPVLKTHCRTREHLRCYLRYGNEDLLEKITSTGEKKEKVKTDENEEPLDETKLWDGFSEVMVEAETALKSDDEDEQEGRFDRFNSKEKSANGEVSATEEVEAKSDAAKPEPDTPVVTAAV